MVALFRIIPKWKQPKCQSADERMKRCGTEWNTFGRKKESRTDTGHNMDEL